VVREPEKKSKRILGGFFVTAILLTLVFRSRTRSMKQHVELDLKGNYGWVDNKTADEDERIDAKEQVKG